MIEGDPDTETLRALKRVAAVSFAPDVEPFCLRKLWLVNGGHLALALFARKENQPSIRAIAREPERQEQLLELYGDMIQTFPPHWHEVVGNSIEYGKRQLIPVCRTEDKTSRILHRMKRANLGPFLEDANRKLGEPARRYTAKVGRQSFGFEDLFEVLHDVLLSLDSYVDATDVRIGKAPLILELDDAAVRSYHQLLEGIVSTDTRSRRVRTLARRLERHRALLV
jgi:hypothetical protein